MYVERWGGRKGRKEAEEYEEETSTARLWKLFHVQRLNSNVSLSLSGQPAADEAANKKWVANRVYRLNHLHNILFFIPTVKNWGSDWRTEWPIVTPLDPPRSDQTHKNSLDAPVLHIAVILHVWSSSTHWGLEPDGSPSQENSFSYRRWSKGWSQSAAGVPGWLRDHHKELQGTRSWKLTVGQSNNQNHWKNRLDLVGGEGLAATLTLLQVTVTLHFSWEPQRLWF